MPEGPIPAAPRRLLASIHDVTPLFEMAIDALADLLERRLGGPRFAMLVVPDFHELAPLARFPGFRARLRGWSDRGVEMFLHGFTHRDDAAHAGRLARLKGRHMTAREGEFLGLGEGEAWRRLADGRAIVEDAIGRPVAGFIAPAWLYSEGARAALREQRFALAEDHLRIWRPSDGAVLARGPVVTWASRNRARKASSLAFAALARRMLAPFPVARVAVHPADADFPDILESFGRTAAALMAGRAVGRYAELGAGGGA